MLHKAGDLKSKELSMIVFGAACFNFGINLNKTAQVSAKEYAAFIEKSLYESDHVQRNSVIIEYDDTFGYSVEEADKIQELEEGFGFPLPMIFSLQFDILIPKLVQEELSKENGLHCIVLKQIRVNIRETFHGPVTFVQVKSDDVDQGSTAVILVREYLKKYFKNKNVYFECIGPSPFHADFSISSAEHSEEISTLDQHGFASSIVPRRGYNHVAFLYSKDLFESEEVALEELLNTLDNELGLFYLMIKFRVQKTRSWEKIDVLYSMLIEKSSKTNLISSIKRMINFDGNLTHQLLHELTMFEIMVLNQTTALQESYDSIYEKELPVYIQSVIDKEFHTRSLNGYPTKQVIYYLEFHEKRFMQIWQTSLLALSALLGAVIGSVITAITSGH